MHSRKQFKKILIFTLLFAFLFAEFSHIQPVYAANLRFYNYNTESNVNYSGKQVIYTYNGRELPLTYPGIIINGTALADYEELFIRELGLQAVLEEETITFSDGTTTLQLTMGSKKAIVNGEAKFMSVAPVKIKIENTIKYYVPSRFVAETFGYEYTWVSNISTVRITKNLQLSINEKELVYNGAFYSINYNENRISLPLPVIYYYGTVYAPAKAVFEAAGCSYKEQDQTIQIAKGDITIQLETNNKAALINDVKLIMGATPLRIVDQTSGTEYSFVPLEFIAEMLGFTLTYEDASKCYTLSETETTGKAEYNPKLKAKVSAGTTDEAVTQAQKPLQYYYEWVADTDAPVEAGQKYLSKVVAYALEDADVVELYGVSRSDINDFIDSGVLIFELKSVITNMENQYFADYTTAHINYTLLTALSTNTKLFFMVPLEDEWYFVEKENCVQVYFMHADLSLEELEISSVVSTDAISYPDDVLVIPMPKKIDISQLADKDNYLEDNFQIMIPGNHLAFYEQNPILNPYSYLENLQITYNSEADRTIITCTTKTICAYEYALENGYLAVHVARPDEIYDKIIVLDAGHGGKDPGADRQGIYEKNINFTILYTYAKEFFENSGIKVYYTRENDTFVSLNKRTKITSEIGADLFISLHMNASVLETANGTEVYYSSANNRKQSSGLRSSIIAKELVTNLCTALGTTNRGALKSDYYVTKYNSVPAVLIELGFLSNKNDFSKLTSATYQKKTAQAIYETVVKLFAEYPTGR